MTARINPITAPANLLLWKYLTRIVPFPNLGQKVQLFPGGTQIGEFIFIEADVANVDFIGIGLSNVQLFALGTPGTMCFTQLSPGDSLQFEDDTTPANGKLTAMDGDVANITITPELNRLDLNQLWAISGPTNTPNTLHITTGSRGR